MTQDIDKQVMELCRLIEKERDSVIFLDLVIRLNQTLKLKDERLKAAEDISAAAGAAPAANSIQHEIVQG